MRNINTVWKGANWRDRVDSTFASWAGSPRSLVWISLLPKLVSIIACPLYCLHRGCPEGRPAVYTLIQCTPLLVEKAAVAPDVTLRLTACKQVSVQVRETPGFKTHGEGHTKSKLRAISDPTKWTLVQQKYLKKKKNCTEGPRLLWYIFCLKCVKKSRHFVPQEEVWSGCTS